MSVVSWIICPFCSVFSPDIHTDTTRPIRIIPFTRLLVLVIHFIKYFIFYTS